MNRIECELFIEWAKQNLGKEVIYKDITKPKQKLDKFILQSISNCVCLGENTESIKCNATVNLNNIDGTFYKKVSLKTIRDNNP